MSVQILGLKEINGPLVILDHVSGISYDEMAEIHLENGTKRLARVVQIEGERAVLQVFEGTNGISLTNTRTSFQGHPMEMPLSTEVLGRIFNGAGTPIDGLGPIFASEHADINGKPLNPVSREYPRNYIRTGISSIDALTTLIRGQKLPIFSGSGMSHNKLAAQIVKQAQISSDKNEKF
ncbi:MAG: V-type ATP synthase subunit B, partial [Oscillospiraceae bacterium]